MLYLVQTSPWHAWRHHIEDASGLVLGHIEAPTWAHATNSRLAIVDAQDAVAAHVQLNDGRYLIRFEYLRRGWVNDVAWWLESPKGDVLARIEKVFPPEAWSLPKHLMTAPTEGELKVLSARKFRRFDARLYLSDGQEALSITTVGWLSLRLRLQISGGFGSTAQQAFMAYYALHLR